MRRGLALLLFGYLVATAWASCGCTDDDDDDSSEEEDGGRGYGRSFIGQRIDDSAFRLERLEARLNDIRNRLETDDQVDHSLDVLAKVDQLDGARCPSGEFMCGENSMCVSDLLACDGREDCPNGDDESEGRCRNRARAGQSFSGRIHWEGCKANPDSDMTIAITANEMINYFPSRVWLQARTTFDTGNDASSYDSAGFLNYGQNSFSLAPPAGKYFNAVCNFVTDDVVDCAIQSSSGARCADVRLSRN